MQIWAAFDSDSTSDEVFHCITTIFRDTSRHLTRCWMLQDLVHCSQLIISRSNMTQNYTVSHTLRNTFSLECMRFWKKVFRHNQLNNSIMQHSVPKLFEFSERSPFFLRAVLERRESRISRNVCVFAQQIANRPMANASPCDWRNRITEEDEDSWRADDR